MGQTTETHAGSIDAVEAFYDQLAPDYDAMTTFEKRFVQEGPFFRLLVRRYGITSAVDAGCGTGFHSIVLASLGVSVTAVDISARMLSELAHHMTGLGRDIRTVQAHFADLPARLTGQFGAVFCMGNTLAHLHTKEDLRGAVQAFARLLVPGGILFAQVLNYDRILAERPETQSVRETPRGTFIRSYEYLGDTIRFTIRKRPPGTGDERVQSVELRPLLFDDFASQLRDTGFDEVHAYGSIAMEPFDPAASKDLVVLAHREGGTRL